jgi:hypothetical protein
MIEFDEAFNEGMRKLKKSIHDEVQVRAMKKVAQVSGVIIRREMRASGVQRSSETGSGSRRSKSQKIKVAGEGSILDIDHKTESYEERDIAFAGHAIHKGAYRARFQGDGTSTHYLWDNTKTITMAGSPNHTGKGYLQNATTSIKADAKSIVSKAIKSAVRKIKQVKVKVKLNAS